MAQTARRGKRESETFMTQLYKDHERLMYHVAKQYTADLFEAEEIIQNALVGLLQKEETLQRLNPYARASYIATTVKNSAINYRRKSERKQRRQVPLETASEAEDAMQTSAADAALLLGEGKDELLRAYEHLSEEERYLLSGKYVLQLSDEELSQALSCQPNSIRMKLTRVRRKLLAALQKEGTAHE